MENEKRKEFLDRLTSTINEISRKKFYEENKEESRQPLIGERVDGYKGFISDLGGEFLEIVENYNQSLQIAKLYELIGDVKLKARIKDFSSSSINSDKKELDDIFGVELVTATEFEKEVLMLFNHLAFNINKDKKYNKKNGYVAYHCMGDFAPNEKNLKERIERTVNGAKAKEYVYTKGDPNYRNKKNLVNIFPNLSEYISNSRNLNELTKVLSEMIEYMNVVKIPKDKIPVIEFHFFISEVEHEAIRGSASHSNYKKTNTKLIERYFQEGRLIRGINAPWKFTANKDGLQLQDFYDTLLENWPFLKDSIVKRRNEGQEIRDREISSKFDVLTASQLPFLRKYLKGNHEYAEEKKDEKWGLLKALIIAHRIDRTENGHELEDEISKIWTIGGNSK